MATYRYSAYFYSHMRETKLKVISVCQCFFFFTIVTSSSYKEQKMSSKLNRIYITNCYNETSVSDRGMETEWHLIHWDDYVHIKRLTHASVEMTPPFSASIKGLGQEEDLSREEEEAPLTKAALWVFSPAFIRQTPEVYFSKSE